jgi:sugar phosphate isomerase/epimerase
MSTNSIPLGLSLHPCIVGFRVPWPALAHLAAETGYQGAVIARDQPPSDETSGDVRVPATAMQLPAEVRKDEATFRSTFARLRDACKFASQFGCRAAEVGIPPSSELPLPEQAELYRSRLQKCCAILDEYSIRLALECITPLQARRAHPHEFIWRFEEMLDFGLSIAPNVGLVIDAWHWHHGGATAESIRNLPADRILDVHIADSPPDPPEQIRDFERLLPGEGVIDLKLFFQLLDGKAYARPVTVEVFGRGLADMLPTDAARLTFETTQMMFRRLQPAIGQ